MAVSAVVQLGWRSVLSRTYAQNLAPPWSKKDIVRFKIGEGGQIGGLPITPDESFIDIQGEGERMTGLCSFSNGIATVIGDGSCTFLIDFVAGDWIKPGARVPPTNIFAPGVVGTEYDEWGQILSVDNNNQITLTAPYAGVSTPEDRPPMKGATPMFVFRKTLTAADVIHLSDVPAITEIINNVGAAEANLTQLGLSPNFYELGCFDSDGVMVCYITFDLKTKIAGVQLVTIGDLVW